MKIIIISAYVIFSPDAEIEEVIYFSGNDHFVIFLASLSVFLLQVLAGTTSG